MIIFSFVLFVASNAEQARYKRTLEDVFALAKEDEIWPILICDMCVESLKCSREYCKMCHDCMNPIYIHQIGKTFFFFVDVVVKTNKTFL